MKALTNFAWAVAAKILSRPAIARWLIERAKRTPYSPIYARNDDTQIYMDRWWIFNPYGDAPDGGVAPARWSFLPSVRVHHICLPDDDDHEHDHPWNARTIILDGWYVEERKSHGQPTRVLRTGDTGPILFGEFHRISKLSEGGVYTLFFTWKYGGTWGFKVGDTKIPYRDYFAKIANGEL